MFANHNYKNSETIAKLTMFKPLDQNNENEIKLKENENNNVIEVAINHIVTRGDEIKHEKKGRKKIAIYKSCPLDSDPKENPTVMTCIKKYGKMELKSFD